MRYDEEKKLIHVTVREAVLTAKRGVSSYQQYDEDDVFLIGGDSRGELLSCEASASPLSFLVSGRLSKEDELFTVCARSYSRAPGAKSNELALLKGEAYCLAYMKIKGSGESSLTFRTRLIPESGEVKEEIHTVSLEKLEAFFRKCISALALAGRIEVERITERLPSMKNAKE